MDLVNLMLSEDEGLSVLLWEFLPHPDQQRLACTCASLAKQYAKPTLEPLKKRSEELFLLQLVSGEEDGEMFDYIRNGNYECRWIADNDGDKSVSTFGTLREELNELLDHVETIDQEPDEFWVDSFYGPENLVEKGRDNNGEDDDAAAESGDKDEEDDEDEEEEEEGALEDSGDKDKNDNPARAKKKKARNASDTTEEETEPRPTKRQRRQQPLLVCSSAFCVQTKNDEPVDDLRCLEPGHRAFCMGCLQDDWRLRYQFYRHHQYSHGWDHAWWGWSKAFANDSDDDDNNGEYRMSFYDDSDVGCAGSWKNEFVLVGGSAPCSTADDQGTNNQSGSSG